MRALVLALLVSACSANDDIPSPIVSAVGPLVVNGSGVASGVT